MTQRIRILDEHTINKIAAGEVIENPSSVVKELVENALDAGATEIHIEIQCGGRQLIRIADNGCGMVQDDALLCLERYATSKIRQVEDLEALLTMGFRGEALPSIAAISKLTLLTSVKDATEGTLLITEAGRILKCCGAAREPGTTIDVKSLFFNIPVRQKFQKSPAYDVTAIQRVVFLQALSHPEVRFTLISDQKPLLVAPSSVQTQPLQRLRERATVVLGSEFVEEAMPISVEDGEFKLYGLLSAPTNHRPNRAGQYVMINHRVVNSILVSMAVRDGYGTALPTGRYPAFVLDLTLSGDLLDVNVHPQKSEVRLRNEQKLRDFIRNAVSAALQGETSVSTPLHALPASTPLFTADATLPPLPWDLPRMPPRAPVPTFYPEVARHVGVMPVAEAPAVVIRQLPVPEETPRVLITVPGYALLHPDSTQHLDPGKSGLWILDQRAGHHRILYDRLASQKQGAIEIEQLLIPLPLSLSALERDLVIDALPDLQRLGFQVEPFGPSSLCLRGIPCEYRGMDVHALIMEIVQELRDFQSQGTTRSERGKHLAQKASHGALSRQRQLSIEAATQLLKELFRCENPYRCPNGQPTLTCLDAQRFAKLFHA